MKYTILLLYFLIVACSTTTESDWPNIPPVVGKWDAVVTFGGSEEDIAHSIISTTDGGFAIIGNTQSIDGDFSEKKRTGSDIFVMKFNSNASLEWNIPMGDLKMTEGLILSN